MAASSRAGPRLSDKWVSGGSARAVAARAHTPRRGDACDDCGWRDCQCAHRKVVRVVRGAAARGSGVSRMLLRRGGRAALQPTRVPRRVGVRPRVLPAQMGGDGDGVHGRLLRVPDAGKTRYTGPTAVALAVDRVDLEYDRSGPDSRHADVACANLVVVGLREGTTIDAALLRRQLRKDTRRDRLDSVLASIKKCEQKRDKAIEATKASLLDVDEGALRQNATRPRRRPPSSCRGPTHDWN